MGRRKDNGSDIAAYIIMFVLAAPVFLVIGILKLIAMLCSASDERKEKEEIKRIEKEKDIEIKQFNKEIEKQKQRENITKSKKFDYIEYYDNLMDTSKYKEYVPKEKPTLNSIKRKNNCLEENILLEKIIRGRKNTRLEQEKECEKIFNQSILEFEKKEKFNKEEYEKQKQEFENNINSKNDEILKRKEKFLKGDAEEICVVLREYLDNKLKDISCDETYSINYNTATRSCIIQYNYYNFDCIPKFVKEFNVYLQEFRTIEVTEKDRVQKYEEYIHRDALRIIDMVFSFDKENIKNVVFNGYVNTLNPATGCDEDFVVLSVKVSQEEFLKINLEKVTPKLCLEAFNYRFVKNLSKIKAIVPFETSMDNEKSILSLENIDLDMNGYEFEDISKELLMADGFINVQVTSSSGDFGADVIAYKNEVKYAIQCKKYSQPVGVKAIQEVMGSKSIYGCHVAVVLTNNTFTPQARKLAEQNNVLLWDRIKLQELIEKYKLQV